jgi:xanthine/CO dehydrogenase XdhC/CoxF family maturation factor
MRGLQEILAALGSIQEPAVLATLVRVKGSSYRKPGARMVLAAAGGQTGVLSAGCLETDLKARVAAVLEKAQPQVAAFDLGSELDLIWGTGMGCQGTAEVLLEPVLPGRTAPWMSLCGQLLAGRRSGVLATVFGVQGETVHPVGERFLLDPQGQSLLPPAGPFAEELALGMAQALAQGTPANLTLPSCSGSLDILIEPLLPPFALWIFGAAEHARPLARLAKELGWFLGIVDHRPALATAERFPEADRIILGHPPESLRELPLDGRSAALVVSHVYDKDRQALAALLQQPLGYLGLQGNRARSARILQELQDEGLVLTEAQRQILHIPAGLDLGAESPEANALSMLAEVQAALANHGGGSLRDRTGSIHGSSRPLALAGGAPSP